MRLSVPILVAIVCSIGHAVPSTKRATGLRFVGVNEAGAEFGSAHLPGIYNTDYTFPDPDSISTFIDKGFNIFRVPIAMERLTPTGLTGALDSAYLGHLKDTINLITGAGAYAVIDPHNFGRFNGAIITSTTDFQSWWAKVAAQFKGNSKVIFDTNNEYNSEPGQLVADLNQAAINGIRAAGATSQYIFVEGNAWSGAWTWTTVSGTDGKTNAQTMGNLTDPSNLIVYEMHQYLDSDGSGTSPTCVSSTIGSERLVAATTWLRSNGKKGILGEFAGAVNSVCEAAVKDMLSYMLSNTDVWTGAIWWAAGPWWPDDQFYGLEPSNGIAYDYYVPVLQSALSGSASPSTSTKSTSMKTTAASTTTKATTISSTRSLVPVLLRHSMGSAAEVDGVARQPALLARAVTM